MTIISFEDIRDLYVKAMQRGNSFIFSKFSVSNVKRTQSSFNATHINSSNWWIIPKMRRRWNRMITGSENKTYEEYISEEIFQNGRPVKMVSIGSGVCSHELRLAELNPHWRILCIDFSDKLLNKAKQTAEEKGLQNIEFLAKNIYEYAFPENHFDIVFFHQSLHHFKNVHQFIERYVYKALTTNGKLIINEYVGATRLQYPAYQRKAINKCLSLIDKPFRTIHKTRLRKNKYYGSGLLRMILADPSECIDSENIIPAVKRFFKVVVEKPFGGNILMSVLKDISHHFVEPTQQADAILEQLIHFEDEYLKANNSDFIFGVYEKK